LQEVDNEQYLELIACYAFDKKKFVEKRIELGEGLIGQAFVEGNSVFLKEVPKGYTHITSGLGEATPGNILIVPMQYNEKSEGVVEIAGFIEWQEYHRNFIDKATEYMAAALSSSFNAEKDTYSSKCSFQAEQLQHRKRKCVRIWKSLRRQMKK
jgi:hypothetical protein